MITMMHRFKSWRILSGWVIVLAVAGTLLGCTGKRPFLMVQLCVESEEELSAFKNTLQFIARSEGMEFIDGSTQTQRDYEALRKSDPSFMFATPVTHVSIEGKKGVGLTASNFSLHKYQIAIGFSEGRRPDTAHRFAETVVQALSKHWVISTVPKDQGAFPMENCPDPAPEQN